MGTLPGESTPGSVVELTTLLRNELCHLSKQDDAVRKLIRGFNVLLHELQEGAGREGAGNLRRGSLSSFVRTPVETSRSDPDARPVRHGKTSISEERLRRACRIALMETDEALSVEEIYSRIVLRGSFPFNNRDHATEAIIRALGALAKEGFLSLDGPRRWKRTSVRGQA
jgi:hypothetical protein